MNSEERSACVKHRLTRAQETLEEAQLLAGAGKFHGAVNRGYYAMFYAVSGLALRDGFVTTSHGQLRSFLNRAYVKTGRIPIELGRAYGAAFDSRTKGDYEDSAHFSGEQVASMLREAEEMIMACDALARATEASDEG